MYTQYVSLKLAAVDSVEIVYTMIQHKEDLNIGLFKGLAVL